MERKMEGMMDQKIQDVNSGSMPLNSSLRAYVDAILATPTVEPQAAPTVLANDTMLDALFSGTVEEWPEPAHTKGKRRHCAAEDRSATLVEIANELGDPPSNQLIAFSVLPSVSLYSRSLGGTLLLCGTNQRLADYSFPRLSIHFLQGFAYLNKGQCMSIRRLAKLDSAIHRLSFLVLFSPFCSVLHLSVHPSSKTSNT
ncbi:hypothetical protein H5410_020937 [Solanum commersonii]|uniref:Uncharacterized protein n=1 Tax=Solanum commersonii TaxID=4109 RepID=A0A9J5ZCS0_SOLCO|nr:hypothetical protein H5410_020937 [Solanum commersonii]